MAHAGRPSLYTDEIAELIIDGLSDGNSLFEICAAHNHLPHRRTIQRWTEERPDFALKCAKARELGAEFFEHRVLQTANDCNEDSAHSAKVKISAYQWIASKRAPKKYGDMSRTEITGADGGPIATQTVDALTDDQLAAIALTGAGRTAFIKP